MASLCLLTIDRDEIVSKMEYQVFVIFRYLSRIVVCFDVEQTNQVIMHYLQ